MPLTELSMDDNDRVRYRSNRLLIPDYEGLRSSCIHESHNNPAAGHPGRTKTYEILGRSYYWLNMHEDVARYVRNCDICRRAKPSRDKYHGLLQPLEPPRRRWAHISIDFVTGLPESRTCDGVPVENIMVVVNRLTKARHFIACDSMKGPHAAKLFYAHVWKLHGLPESIVSDRGAQFESAFWKSLCNMLRIKASLTTAYHLEGDGQTEIANAAMEQVLRCYTSYLQDDWAECLHTAEFACNNWESATTGLTPFFANSGQHPRIGNEPIAPQDPTADDLVMPEDQALEFATNMDKVESYLHDEMLWAQAVYEKQANRRRMPPPNYKVGDRVYLSARNLRTRRPSPKLDWKSLGPYKIIERVGPLAFRLELPPTMAIHDVFHVNLLRPAPDDPLTGQALPAPPPVFVDDLPEYAVEAIVDSMRDRRRGVLYKVQWVGYAETT